MSTNVIGNKVYKNIDDLPQVTSITDGDKFIIQTKNGTELLDFFNFKVDLDHTTFQASFQVMLDMTSTVSTFITTINQEFDTMKNDFENIKTSFNTLQSNFDGLIFMMKAIVGAYEEKDTYTDYYNKLSAEGRSFVDTAINDINETIAKNAGLSSSFPDTYVPYDRNLLRAQMAL